MFSGPYADQLRSLIETIGNELDRAQSDFRSAAALSIANMPKARRSFMAARTRHDASLHMMEAVEKTLEAAAELMAERGGVMVFEPPAAIRTAISMPFANELNELKQKFHQTAILGIATKKTMRIARTQRKKLARATTKILGLGADPLTWRLLQTARNGVWEASPEETERMIQEANDALSKDVHALPADWEALELIRKANRSRAHETKEALSTAAWQKLKLSREIWDRSHPEPKKATPKPYWMTFEPVSENIKRVFGHIKTAMKSAYDGDAKAANQQLFEAYTLAAKSKMTPASPEEAAQADHILKDTIPDIRDSIISISVIGGAFKKMRDEGLIQNLGIETKRTQMIAAKIDEAMALASQRRFQDARKSIAKGMRMALIYHDSPLNLEEKEELHSLVRDKLQPALLTIQKMQYGR